MDKESGREGEDCVEAGIRNQLGRDRNMGKNACKGMKEKETRRQNTRGKER